MKLISQGAEAKIYLDKDIIIKERIQKKYRDEKLDLKIRIERSKKEASFLKKMKKYGINAPDLIDLQGFKIYMSYINAKNLPLKKENIIRFAEAIADMHSYNIIHNDLSPKNVMYKDGKIFFIDFGLSFFSSKIEDKATDLLVFKSILKAEKKEELWDLFLNTYENKYIRIEKKISEIEKRKRYL